MDIFHCSASHVLDPESSTWLRAVTNIYLTFAGSKGDAKPWASRVGAVGNMLPAIQRPHDAVPEGIYRSYLIYRSYVMAPLRDNYVIIGYHG